jgi:hypothetical protein
MLQYWLAFLRRGNPVLSSVVCRMPPARFHMLRFSMLAKPKLLLHVEGAAILILCVFFYHQLHAGWLLFAILFLAPDLFMLGYLANVRIGSAVYNFAHTCITPGILLAIAYLAVRPQLFPIALIWTAHIGFDRLLGFGLKYPSNFKDTHLQRV